MTTLCAIAAGIIFFKTGALYPLIAIWIFGAIQLYTKSIMMEHYRKGLADGLSLESAAVYIPDGCQLPTCGHLL